MATSDDPKLADEDGDKPMAHRASALGLEVNTAPLSMAPGREGSHIEQMLYRGRSMAVFTSGGDSSGWFHCFFLKDKKCLFRNEQCRSFGCSNGALFGMQSLFH